MDDASAARLLVLLGQYTERYYGNEPDCISVRELVDDLTETLPGGDVHRTSSRGTVIEECVVLKEEVEQAVYQCRIWR
jgi:hypothetical protein